MSVSKKNLLNEGQITNVIKYIAQFINISKIMPKMKIINNENISSHPAIKMSWNLGSVKP